MTLLTSFLYTVLSFAFALGVIIVVHEAGHLLVAKAFGVRVMTFSVGFGKRLWGIQRGETEYRVAAVPLGGYVRLGGENPEEVDPADPREFLNKPRWQRILVYLAGPLANVLLAILIFGVVFMIGIDVMSYPDIPTVVGAVEAGSSAERAGVEGGDKILAVQGAPVESWQDVTLEMAGAPGKPLDLTVQRGERTLHFMVTPKLIPRYEAGDWAGMRPSATPQIRQVIAGQPAEAAGFRVGDEVLAVDGKPVFSTESFIEALSPLAGRRVEVSVLRDGRPLTLTVTPRNDNGEGRIGVGIGYYRRLPPAQAFVAGARYSWEIVEQSFQVLAKIFTRQISAKTALSGPIEIARQSGEAARIGFKYLLQLMGLVSVSIAVMNLLPIPILDGGQISVLLIEGVMRRDLSLRIKEVISQVGFVMILLLMFVVIYFDVMKNLPAGLKPGG